MLDSLFSLNFGLHQEELGLQQVALTPDANISLHLDQYNMKTSIHCVLVVVGNKYSSQIEKIQNKVDQVSKSVGRMPLAMFYINDGYAMDMFDFQKSILKTTMV